MAKTTSRSAAATDASPVDVSDPKLARDMANCIRALAMDAG